MLYQCSFAWPNFLPNRHENFDRLDIERLGTPTEKLRGPPKKKKKKKTKKKRKRVLVGLETGLKN